VYSSSDCQKEINKRWTIVFQAIYTQQWMIVRDATNYWLIQWGLLPETETVTGNQKQELKHLHWIYKQMMHIILQSTNTDVCVNHILCFVELLFYSLFILSCHLGDDVLGFFLNVCPCCIVGNFFFINPLNSRVSELSSLGLEETFEYFQMYGIT